MNTSILSMIVSRHSCEKSRYNTCLEHEAGDLHVLCVVCLLRPATAPTGEGVFKLQIIYSVA